MAQVSIEEITGGVFPAEVYISTVTDEYLTLIGAISSGTTVPPIINYNATIPTIFNTAPIVKITIIDSYGCKRSKNLECELFYLLLQDFGYLLLQDGNLISLI